MCCWGQDFKFKGRSPTLTLVHHTLHTAHGHCVLHTAPVQKKRKNRRSAFQVPGLNVLYSGLPFTELTFYIIDCFSISSLMWGFLSAQTDSNLSVPPTSLRILLLLFAHCTPAQVQCTASGRIIRWLLVHSHRSVICKGIHVSPEGSLLQLLNFGIF